MIKQFVEIWDLLNWLITDISILLSVKSLHTMAVSNDMASPPTKGFNCKGPSPAAMFTEP